MPTASIPSIREQLDTEGYVVVEDVLDPVLDIQPVLDEYAAVLDGIVNDLYAQGLISQTFAGLPFVQRLVEVCVASGRNFPQHFDFSLPQNGVTPDTPIHVGPAVFHALTNPRLLDLVESIIGPEIASNPVQHIRMKLPPRAVAKNAGYSGLISKTPWHQDNGVVLPEADQANILTVWFPLTEATVDNGCLQVIPRSHLTGLTTHCPAEAGLTIPPTLLPDHLPAVPLPMRPGSVLLMTKRTIHSSLDNVTSDQVRISMDLRYQPVGEPSGRPAFASAGFVARSRAHPEQVLRDPAAWARAWLAIRDRLAAEQNPSPFNRWTADAAVCA
jgi:hypothetical protein